MLFGVCRQVWLWFGSNRLERGCVLSQGGPRLCRGVTLQFSHGAHLFCLILMFLLVFLEPGDGIVAGLGIPATKVVETLGNVTCR